METLRNAKDRGRGCSLLIGAGCSATAKIPLAGEIVQELAKKYPTRYARVEKKSSYPHCMAELAYDERSDLLAPYIDRAKINWAHVAIAQLTKAGYVTRILTTNFDPLIAKACATVGVFPAIYDLAASQTFRADRVYEPSVFYLHGQRTGFVTLHTDEEVKRHKQTLAPVFEDAGKGRVWIVCGYSGENDPVFDHLADVPAFGSNLYWVGYKDTLSSEHVREKLLVKDKYAYYVAGHDADGFFVELARQLDCFPPTIISKPFTHLLETTDLLAPFTIGDGKDDLRQVARTRIKAAIEAYEQGGEATAAAQALRPDALDAMSLLFSGKYDEVLRLFRDTESPSDELRAAAAQALLSQGIEAHQRAMTAAAGEMDALFRLAGEKYAAALDIKRDKHDALYNWGIALMDQARTKTGAEADGLWQAAGEKYQAALQIKPDDHEALHNWASLFLARAWTVPPEEREPLLEAAEEKCLAANEIVPGFGSYNLACVYGIRGDASNCRKWLLHSREHGQLPSRDHLLNDGDLAAFREEAWFRELVGDGVA